MAISFLKGKIRFDRNELGGSFGDIGTDLPLIIGMILTCKLDTASTLIMFGAMQVLTGIIYGMPMPVQPLKAMAVIMISQKLGGNVLYGAGLSIGIIMLMLSSTGLLSWLGRLIPLCVVRGIQLGLGLSLSTLALKTYVLGGGVEGYVLAGVCFLIILFLLGSRKYPAALAVIAIGALWAVAFKLDIYKISRAIGFAVPEFFVPGRSDILQGLLVLVVPQIALSLSNSIIATKQTANDLFPDKKISIGKIGLTYSLMNLINPFFSGIPTCHGAGGMAGHYAFGARTGGSTIIYGSLYLLAGLFFSRGFEEVIKMFPLPILGVVLLFEGISLMSFVKDITGSKADLFVALLVAVCSLCIPNGFAIGLIIGTIVAYMIKKNVLKVW
jgi:MFS superfamily sulfate permease-like transporter